MTAYAPASACGRGCLPRPDAVARAAWPTRLVRLACVVALLVCALGVAASMGILARDRQAMVVRTWFRALLRSCGVRLVVRGDQVMSEPGPMGTLVAANHVSWLDIPAVLAVEPVRVLAKTDVRTWPVLGVLAARAGTVFIDRRRLRRLPATVAEIAAALRRGESVLVFPEGSTWCGRTQGRFYPATLQSAIDAGVAVRPVAVRYHLQDGTPTTVAAFVGDDTLLAAVWRVVATRGLAVEVEIGQPLSTQDETRQSLATQVAATVNATVTGRGLLAPAGRTHLV